MKRHVLNAKYIKCWGYQCIESWDWDMILLTLFIHNLVHKSILPAPCLHDMVLPLCHKFLVFLNNTFCTWTSLFVPLLFVTPSKMGLFKARPIVDRRAFSLVWQNNLFIMMTKLKFKHTFTREDKNFHSNCCEIA